jgi:hypothetical protein
MPSNTGRAGNRTRILLITSGVILQILFIALLLLGDWRQQILPFLAIYFCAFAIYLYLVSQLLHEKLGNFPAATTFIIVASFIFRLTVFWSEPSLSTDIYRYIWDGKVQNAGFNPYDQTPRAKQLEFLRDENYEKINHKDFWTAYPPAAQNLFRFLTFISDSEHVFKFGILIFDFILILVLKKILESENRSTLYVLIYAWQPLAIIEFGAQGHIDVVAIALMFLTFYLLHREMAALSGIALALATLTKYLPIISLPWIIRRGNWRLAVSLIAVTVLLIWQYYTSEKMFSGLFTFYRKWWFNDSLFGILYRWLGGAEPARMVGGIAVLISSAVCWFRKYSIYRSLMIIFGTIIAFAPVVHPWYVCWIIPLLAFHMNPAWLFFSGWIAMAYVIIYVYPVGKWSHDDWFRLVVYGPLYGLLLAGWVRGLIRRQDAINVNK